MPWNELPDFETVKQAVDSLRSKTISADFVPDSKAAKDVIMSLIPKGSEVMNMTSVTVDAIGIADQILDTNDYISTRKKLNKEEDKRKQKIIGSSPQFTIGSAHAITTNGEIMIASNTGSQLPAYAYGSDKVIFVVGAQKIVKNLDEGMRRIYEHSLPLESERAKKAYGVPGSSVNKILIINREIVPERIHVVIVNEVLGF